MLTGVGQRDSSVDSRCLPATRACGSALGFLVPTHMLAAVPCVCSCALCLLPGIPGLRMGRLGSPRTNWLARLVGISKLQAQGRMTKEDTRCQLQASKAACALVRRHQKTHEHTHQGKGTWTPQTQTCVKKKSISTIVFGDTLKTSVLQRDVKTD